MNDETKKILKAQEDYQREYREECLKELQDSGLGFLTGEQAEMILEPSHAPENYACDGEISNAEAFRNWKGRLAETGLSPKRIKEVIKYTGM